MSYADHLCAVCGKKIVIRLPKNDAGKSELDQADEIHWKNLQQHHAVRCLPCARKIARTKVAKMQAAGIEMLDEDHIAVSTIAQGVLRSGA